MTPIARRVRELAAAALVALACAAAHAADVDALATRYAAWQPTIGRGDAGPSLAVSSTEDAGLMRGDIDGVVNARFDVLADRLASPRNWCDIALLHLNVKSCTHKQDARGTALTFYSGGKRFETPERAHPMRYAFRVAAMRADYLAVELTAPSGPLDTHDYAIVVEAMPAGAQTFVHLRYAYRPSLSSRFATRAYLASAGNGKKGFSVVGRDGDGKPEYVGGVRGIVERNAVRNFLAIQAFLDSAETAPRGAARFARWFDLTERYAEQLHELDRGEYLAIKQQERAQQLALQHAVDADEPDR